MKWMHMGSFMEIHCDVFKPDSELVNIWLVHQVDKQSTWYEELDKHFTGHSIKTVVLKDEHGHIQSARRWG